MRVIAGLMLTQSRGHGTRATEVGDMTRTKLNVAIDAAAFVAFLFLLSTGLMLQYQLPVGSGGVQGRGMGRGAAEREISLLWGWTRHDWGQIHYWIAGALVAVLAVHVVLHWKWIVCVMRGTHSDASGFRFGVGLASMIGLVLLAAVPFIAGTEQKTRGELRQTPESGSEHIGADESNELRGSMTVAEVAKATHLSVAELLGKLKLPEDAAPDARMGRLLRQHGMQMSDVHRILGESATNEPSPAETQ